MAPPHLPSDPEKNRRSRVAYLGLFGASLILALLLVGSGFSSGRSEGAATVWLAPNGDDGSCERGRREQPCASFNRAYQVARGGDKVLVAGGNYPMSEPAAGANTVYPSSKAGWVAFRCLDDRPVTFSAPNFSFYPGVSRLIVRGGCFRFHVVHFGYGGYEAQTHDIVLRGVHMTSFECAGCGNVTIRSSEIGPAVACDAPGGSGVGTNGGAIPQSAWCDPSKPDEAYLARLPGGSSNLQMEPYIHNGAAGLPTKIAIIGNRIHGIQTKDSFNLHTGGLLIWNVNGLVVRGNTFDHNAIYDILSNAGDVENNVLIEDNVFGWPVYPLEPSQPNPGSETLRDWRELDLGYPGAAYSNWLIRRNLFAHGLYIQGAWSDARVVGNVLGNWSTCSGGVSYDYNVGVKPGRACGGLLVRSHPYRGYLDVDFRLNDKSKAARYLAAHKHSR